MQAAAIPDPSQWHSRSNPPTQPMQDDSLCCLPGPSHNQTSHDNMDFFTHGNQYPNPTESIDPHAALRQKVQAFVDAANQQQLELCGLATDEVDVIVRMVSEARLCLYLSPCRHFVLGSDAQFHGSLDAVVSRHAFPRGRSRRDKKGGLSVLRRLVSNSELERVGGSCWHCKLTKKGCDAGDSCKHCSALGIRCRRGLVYDFTESPLYCVVVTDMNSATTTCNLPPALQAAVSQLANSKSRLWQLDAGLRHPDSSSTPFDNMKGGIAEILHSVITAKVDFTDFNPYPDIVPPRKLPYHRHIIQIVWELTDCPHIAPLMGVTVVEELVALLEAASACEARFGRWNVEKRLVYTSMLCLLYCARAIRLSSLGLMMFGPHSLCPPSTCISPAFADINKYVSLYVQILSSAIFNSTKRTQDSAGLLVFYSFCIQNHVRHALISLEQSWQHIVPKPLTASNYLHAAISLFQQISAQNQGNELADQVRRADPAPSLFLGTQQLAALGGNWQKWQREGINGYLGRIFELDNQTSRPTTAVTRTSSDSARTVRLVPKMNHTAAATPHVATSNAMDWTSAGFSSPTSSSSSSTPHMQVYPHTLSMHSATSIADSDPSWINSVNPSLLSVSTSTSTSTSAVSDGMTFPYFDT